MRAALLRQWGRIADAADRLDLEHASRIEGWRNAEVLAHLAVQPVLLGRFLATGVDERPEMTLSDNLAGTGTLAEMIDRAARDGARQGRTDFARAALAAMLPPQEFVDIATGRTPPPPALAHVLPLMT